MRTHRQRQRQVHTTKSCVHRNFCYGIVRFADIVFFVSLFDSLRMLITHSLIHRHRLRSVVVAPSLSLSLTYTSTVGAETRALNVSRTLVSVLFEISVHKHLVDCRRLHRRLVIIFFFLRIVAKVSTRQFPVCRNIEKKTSFFSVVSYGHFIRQ